MQHHIINQYKEFLNSREFPCVAARAAASRNNVRCMVVGEMACGKDDRHILKFLYDFVEEYRIATTAFHSAAIIFESPTTISEEIYEELLWQRLQSISQLDAQLYGYDPRVSHNPTSGKFSFSLKSEAFFIIGLNPSSSRPARRFAYPAIVFNPHAEFVQMRNSGSYGKMKDIVRKRDIEFSGSINPMLDDFGNLSETRQYSGKQYDDKWQCPLKIKHETNEYNSAT